MYSHVGEEGKSLYKKLRQFWRCGGSLVQRTRLQGRGHGFESSISHNNPDALQDHCVKMQKSEGIEREKKGKEKRKRKKKKKKEKEKRQRKKKESYNCTIRKAQQWRILPVIKHDQYHHSPLFQVFFPERKKIYLALLLMVIIKK